MGIQIQSQMLLICAKSPLLCCLESQVSKSDNLCCTAVRDGRSAVHPLRFPVRRSLLNICREIVERWSETQNVVATVQKEDEVQGNATLIEKQAQIVVKPRMVSEEEKHRKAALLAQYADVTDEEDEADEKDDSSATVSLGSDRSLFHNTKNSSPTNLKVDDSKHRL
ncbi:coiled-coil domain-containing protein 43-like [Sorex fumeus]|uniref:coiled-coil domain-containing protein 43-like n=1 Tax=Sorex fumeus TaxID=62283 RepID=UPI0024AC96CE|nr:coiled-coil domain-containing protein 43-like [Sorex fumeus]